jgi:hypothetical protein
MKHFFLLCIAVTACIISFSQKDFEGIVTYRITGPEGKEEEEIMTVYFAPGCLLIKNSGDRGDRGMLIRLDSGKVYRLRHEQKEYRVNNLAKAIIIPERAPKHILGYSSKAIQLKTTWGMNMSAAASIYISDDLTYHVPPQYWGNDQLAMIYNDHIILDGIIYLGNEMYDGNYKDDEHPSFKLEAIKVEAQAIDRSLLEIPKDYTSRDERYRQPEADSVQVMVDSVATTEPPQPPPPAKKPPVKKPVPKTTGPKPAMSNKQ